ncbi:MAG TPA: DUF6119 family protein [Streptosporangiaceae bacterium]|nr:DUF6119 family protein [Streptosporangiaceae bacterium]
MPRSSAPRTRRQTLYRLSGVDPTLERMRQAIDIDDAHPDFTIAYPAVLGVPAIWAHGSSLYQAKWCGDASITTGLMVSYLDQHAGGVLVLAVDDEVFAIGYGTGRWLIKDDCKDQAFGIQFAIRQLEPDSVNRVVQRRPGSRGRQDSTLVPDGLPIWCYGLESYSGVVGHLGGALKASNLTFGGTRSRQPRFDGSAGLSLRLGVMPDDLVADIRQISAICRRKPPDSSLEQLISITPVDRGKTADQLNADLDEVLSWTPADAADYMAPVVPTARHDDYLTAESLKIKIGPASPHHVDQLELADILAGTRFRPAGTRVQTLRDGYITLYADPDGNEPIGRTAAINWIEATQSIGPNRYFLLDGTWYKIGETYLESIRQQIQSLIPAQPSVQLPTWDPTWAEGRYNQHVQDTRPGYVNLDAKLIRAGIHTAPGFEACDLLGPDDELLFIKRAQSSEPLSHLFSQALVSVQTLMNSPDARTKFADRVKEQSGGKRQLPQPFTPAKAIFGILLKNGKKLTPDTLFPFSQVTLSQAARELQTRYHITVETIPVEAESV